MDFRALRNDFVEKTIPKHFQSVADLNELCLDADLKDDFKDAGLIGRNIGRKLLGQAVNNSADYPIWNDDRCVVMIPFGALQSLVHIICLPKVPLYNAVSLEVEHIGLLKHMSAVLEHCVTEIMTPGSDLQKQYLKFVQFALGLPVIDRRQIIFKQSKHFDTEPLLGGNNPVGVIKAMNYLEQKLEKFHRKHQLSMDQYVATTLHIHPHMSVGHLHMHGFVSHEKMITDMGRKFLYKNKPVSEILEVLEDISEEKSAGEESTLDSTCLDLPQLMTDVESCSALTDMECTPVFTDEESDTACNVVEPTYIGARKSQVLPFVPPFVCEEEIEVKSAE